MEWENEIFEYYRRIKEYTDKLNAPRLSELINNFEERLVPYLLQEGKVKMKLSIQNLSAEIAQEINLPEESVKSAVQSIRSGIDHAVAEQHISSRVKTLQGISMTNLTNEGLVTVASSGSGLDRAKSQLTVQNLQERIIQDLNKGYEIEIEGLGTYCKPSGAKELDLNSELEFQPLLYPDIP